MKLPGKFILTSWLSCAISILITTVTVVLTIVTYFRRNDCSVGNITVTSGSQYVWSMIFSHYLQNDECPNSFHIGGLTKSETVLVLMNLNLVSSIVLLLAAVVLVISIWKGKMSMYLDFVTYCYVGVFISAFVVDLTIASFFGIDYRTLTSLMANTKAGIPENYKLDAVRFGAISLMVIALKGYVVYGINGILVAMMIIYLQDFINHLTRNEHSIHTEGVLDAYELSPRNEEIQQWQEDLAAGFDRREMQEQPECCHHTAVPFAYTERPRRPLTPKHRLSRRDTMRTRLSTSLNEGIFLDEDDDRPRVLNVPPPRRCNPELPECWHYSHFTVEPFMDRPRRNLTPQRRLSRRESERRRRERLAKPPVLPQPDYSPEPKPLKSALKATVHI